MGFEPGARTKPPAHRPAWRALHKEGGDLQEMACPVASGDEGHGTQGARTLANFFKGKYLQAPTCVSLVLDVEGTGDSETIGARTSLPERGLK